jgi:diacylglycerol O-acyltransferase / wax synthase
VTNVPGPQMPIYLLGRELEDMFPVGFLPPDQTLFVAIMSYNGAVNFGLLADYDSMEDVQTIADGIEGSLADLGAAAEEVRREAERAAGEAAHAEA